MGNSQQDVQPIVLDIRAAARHLFCSESHIRLMIRTGSLKARKLGRRVVILREEIEKYLGDLPDWKPGRTPTAAVEARLRK